MLKKNIKLYTVSLVVSTAYSSLVALLTLPILFVLQCSEYYTAVKIIIIAVFTGVNIFLYFVNLPNKLNGKFPKKVTIPLSILLFIISTAIIIIF